MKVYVEYEVTFRYCEEVDLTDDEIEKLKQTGDLNILERDHDISDTYMWENATDGYGYSESDFAVTDENDSVIIPWACK